MREIETNGGAKTKMKCFYHRADLDGLCSGELIRRAHPECEMIGIDHGDPFPWDSIRPGETVYMVDFSLQPWHLMVKLSEACDLVWIDHHKSAIEENAKHPIKFRGKAVSGLGACALVWEWLRDNEKIFVCDYTPRAVQLLAEYDVFDHHDPDCLPFQYGMRIRDTSLGAPIWQDVLFGSSAAHALLDTIRDGQVALYYQKQQDALAAKALCFETELDGLRCIAVNRGMIGSQFFDAVWDPEKHDAKLAFWWTGKHWKVSLYSDKVDVSGIAKARGGGGHAGASGFQCDELPFALE
jgi:hypothetical protein